ncbi:cytochrome P450 [Pholiota conissans]|uniref:Cytochrome P450 n=1 Tax=Pholiota conissans TaxID=109636 RepID=A0A9P5Z9F5_9AGAR|nr:cytochrome P450 [Pholiota conissans]
MYEFVFFVEVLTINKLSSKGSVLHFRVYWRHIIVLNSYAAGIQFLEKHSNIYSANRPDLAIIDMMGWGFNATLMRYGSRWRSHRRMYQQIFKPETVSHYDTIQTRKVVDFLCGLLKTPEDFVNHYRTLPGAVIMSAVYGHDGAQKNDCFVELAEAAIERLGYVLLPGTALVNMLPILRHIPTWFPGAGFKRFALESRNLVLQMRNIPLASVEMKMVSGTSYAGVSFTSPYLICISFQPLSTGLLAGADTVRFERICSVKTVTDFWQNTSVLGTFFSAMAMFPDVQAKAQKEIDLIIGSERLVNFEDRSSLPYIEALRREILRWRPVLPLGVMRAAGSDDVYNGHYIPKGATIIYNTWAMAHDPIKYSDPDSFNPARFFNKDGNLNEDEVSFAFGFGRRMCLGRHFAIATAWLAMATVLQNLNIRKKRDSSGHEIPISGRYGGEMLRHVFPFECSIEPRSTEARQIILDTAQHM